MPLEDDIKNEIKPPKAGGGYKAMGIILIFLTVFFIIDAILDRGSGVIAALLLVGCIISFAMSDILSILTKINWNLTLKI
jgi:hypothetical protein